VTPFDDKHPSGESGDAPSRLEQHYAILGLGGRVAADDPRLAADRRVMDAAKPLPLDFGKKAGATHLVSAAETRWVAPVFAGLAIAAVAAFTIFKRPPDAGWRTMGGGHVQLYVEEHGQVRPWADGMRLGAGAKVRAEVLAEAPTLAFWGVTSRGGELLVDQAWIEGQAMRLGVAEKKLFEDGAELDAKDDGERLSVVTCPETVAGAASDASVEARSALVAAVATVMRTGEAQKGAAGCQLSRYVLRP
jgi:hypothetical protein